MASGKVSMKWAVELFGLLSGVTFAASAALNALYFRMYLKIDYFLVATPSDVIMSSFKTITTLIVVTTITFLAACAFLLTILVLFLLSALALRLITKWKPKRRQITSPQVMNFATWVFKVIIVASALFSIPMSSNYSTIVSGDDIAISMMSDLPSKCFGSKILWVGERNVIALCPHGVTTIPTDKVVIIDRQAADVEGVQGSPSSPATRAELVKN